MTSHGQNLLRQIIQATIRTGTIIENYRPDWLNGLELDFWIPAWNLAFEFQGDQHFSPVYGIEALAAQQVRDKIKRKICEERGVMLLTFDASMLEPQRVKFKLSYHLARKHPEMKKGERHRLMCAMLLPKRYSKEKRKKLIRAKSIYCQNLKNAYNSPTAYRKGSAVRREAKREKFDNIPWWKLEHARQSASSYYASKPLPPPKIGMGMARAKAL